MASDAENCRGSWRPGQTDHPVSAPVTEEFTGDMEEFSTVVDILDII